VSESFNSLCFSCSDCLVCHFTKCCSVDCCHNFFLSWFVGFSFPLSVFIISYLEPFVKGFFKVFFIFFLGVRGISPSHSSILSPRSAKIFLISLCLR
jgi:hypothetical protein